MAEIDNGTPSGPVHNLQHISGAEGAAVGAEATHSVQLAVEHRHGEGRFSFLVHVYGVFHTHTAAALCRLRSAGGFFLLKSRNYIACMEWFPFCFQTRLASSWYFVRCSLAKRRAVAALVGGGLGVAIRSMVADVLCTRWGGRRQLSTRLQL